MGSRRRRAGHGRHHRDDFTYVKLADELPRVGDKFESSEPFGSVESVKAVSEIYMPIGGEVLEVNSALNEEPEKVNNDPYGDGWMVVLKPTNLSEIDALLTAIEYEDYIKEEASE